MDTWDKIIIFIFGIIFIAALFFGAITAIKKSFQAVPQQKSNFDSSALLRDQREQMKETQDRQRQLMQDRRQRMEDYRNR